MKKFLYSFFLTLTLAASCMPMVSPARAASDDPFGFGKKLDDVAGSYATQGCTSDNCLVERVGFIIQVVLSFLGVIFLILMLYAGLNWMTAGGEEERINKAKNTIRAAIIGLLIVIGAYAASVFVIEQIWGAASNPTTNSGGANAAQQ